MAAQENGTPGAMPTTHWSVVARAGGGDEAALEALLRRYQGPLQIHLRLRFRASPEDAADWFQGFVQEKVLERSLLGSADRARGRFRTFLLNSLERYVIQIRRRATAQKRHPPNGLLPLEDAISEADATTATSAAAFDVAWGRAVIEEALGRMEAECVAKGRSDIWGVFKDRLSGPILYGDPVVPYPELVSRFGFASPVEAANLLTTGKRMFQRQLEAVVGEYCQSVEEIRAELHELERILGNS